ncbi:TetR/AcrR family transcriptional regulator [Sphingorhabdus sp. EL138]|uniref:TetR/AcrR family transcriptional regulator n=1 Tax=Sphingorhabdus sp. EL138 TaxID=2073156 RepID=UPI000D69F3F0|nr:TetR family transcriptional regulator [Sphingorhabdus sp. EL138]
MSTRQVIGKRRSISSMQSRGVARREALVAAAIEMLNDQTPQELAFKAIADKANVPEGSAYHFYANKYDLFADVAGEMSELFQEAQSKPIDPDKVENWHDIVGVLVERGANVYKRNPVARRLLIGSTTPPEIKQIDRENNRRIAAIMAERFADIFDMPNIPDFEQKLYYFIEITDTLFTVEHREKRAITNEIVEEAKRVAIGYLGTYLPSIIPRRKVASDTDA